MISHRVNRYLQALAQIRSQPGNHPIIVENLLQSTTLELWTSMDRLRILVRTGPSLGCSARSSPWAPAWPHWARAI